MSEGEKIWPPAPTAPPPSSAAFNKPQTCPLGWIAAMWAMTGVYLALSCCRLPVPWPLFLERALVLGCSVGSFALGLWLVTRADTQARLHGGARIGVSLLIAVFGFFHALIRF